MVIVGDELFSNIVKYGYENKGGEILVNLSFDDRDNGFTLIITDHAKPFNQLDVNKQAVGDDMAELNIGGLGILIVKSIMDEYSYEYKDGSNILTLSKRL